MQSNSSQSLAPCQIDRLPSRIPDIQTGGELCGDLPFLPTQPVSDLILIAKFSSHDLRLLFGCHDISRFSMFIWTYHGPGLFLECEPDSLLDPSPENLRYTAELRPQSV